MICLFLDEQLRYKSIIVAHFSLTNKKKTSIFSLTNLKKGRFLVKRFNIKSKKGFTLIELLVVIGILAVLAAIAIPSVAGLIDRANVSADKTNSNEMTNAIERFASEYELYCQDIASGALDPDNLDSAQGRVKNVVGVTTRAGIEDLEIGQGETVADDVVAIYRDTKYPVNATTIKKVVENYTKTSSSTFEPKQSDMHYWYSPDCGVVVFAEPDALSDKENKLNAQIQSGMDAKGNDLGPATQWIDLTLGAALSGGNSVSLPEKGKTLEEYSWEEVRNIIASGKAGEYGFAVGGTKTLSINGATKTATIIGLNHDGENTATFMVMSSIATRTMTSDGKNAGGWEQSAMRTWLNSTVLDSMSNKNQIKTVNKKTNNTGYQSTSITETSDSVFLLSPIECGFDCPTSYEEYSVLFNAEGSVYEWFNGHSINTYIWLRSATATNKNNFFCYGNDGKLYGSAADNEYSVFPAFVIG